MDTTIIKECPKHGMTEHVLIPNGNYKCKECRKNAVLDIRRRNKIKLVEYKGGKCEICGYNKCIDALEFHHLNPNEKDFGVSCGDTRSIEKLKAEVDKCIMVCANCHREIHAKEREEKRLLRHEEEKKKEEIYFENNPKKEKIDLNDIINDVNAKIPKKDIAKKNGVSVKVIKTLLKKNGIEYNESHTNITSTITVDDFVQQFKKYGSFSQLSNYYGVSDNAIRKWCRRNDIPWKKEDIIKFVKNYEI